jgi:hypothetical protein
MRLEICLAGLLMFLATPIHSVMAQEAADPLTGTWKGDWGPSATDRNSVTLELKWNGKTLTGTVNPGPDSIPLENASFDPKTMKVHLEANYAPRSLRYVVDGTVEKDKMSGTWNHPRRKGDFQVSRDVKQAESHAASPPNLAGLKDDEKKVVDYLLKDWRDWEQDYSITTVDIAMAALGQPSSSEKRFRIGNYIKNHPELDEILRQWGWQTVVLTPSEKLVARAIVNAERDKQKAPDKSELARLVGISEKEADDALRTLSRFGILKRNRSAGGVGYIAGAPRYVNWQPWLDFQFHRITLSSGRTFCVN